MTRLLFASSVQLLTALVLLGCGSGRQLQSVALSPATADAKNFPNGQVTFTATGTYSQPPSPVQLTSKDIVWCMGVIGTTAGQCVGNVNPGGTVDQNGVAQCNFNFVGTATVLAGTAIPNPTPMADSGAQLKVYGSAQMTCP